MATDNLNNLNDMEAKWNRDDILEIIRKCLALATSSNEFEAAAAMSKAQSLLEKYNISISSVQQKDPSSVPDMIEGEAPYDDDYEPMLAFEVAKHNFCKVVVHNRTKKMSIIGRYVNVVSTVEMFRWIRNQMENFAMKEVSNISHDGRAMYSEDDGKFLVTNNYYHRINKRAYRHDFLTGMTERVVVMLDKSAEERRFVAPGLRALTINLLAESQAQQDKLYPVLGRYHNGRVSNQEAYAKGQSMAGNVAITRPSDHISGGTLRLGSGS
jgi:hypothetical protein